MESNVTRACADASRWCCDADDRRRPWGGTNLLGIGDWRQLGPVRTIGLCSNPFGAMTHARRVLQQFWSSGADALTVPLFELTVSRRAKNDPRLQHFLEGCRNGSQTGEE